MEFYLDDDWNLVQAPATANDLAHWATVFQQKYFPDCQVDVKITVNVNPQFQGASCFVPSEMLIHIGERITPLHHLARIALLHEMVHVKLFAENGDADGGHGVRFKSEIKRLQAAGAYDDLL